MRFAFLLLFAVMVSGCDVADRATEKQPTTTRSPASETPLSVLPTAVADSVWHRSAKLTANEVRDLLANDQVDEAIALTRQAFELPRHRDRNDSYGWGHATRCLSLLIDGLVEAERWDSLIEIGHDSNARIGNEYVESQRIRALALAHWKKRQLRFRSRLLMEDLKALGKSLVRRIDENQDWNEINSPKDQIKVDMPFVETTKKHITTSQTFIKTLEQSLPTAELATLKQGYLESKWNVSNDVEAETSSSSGNRFEELGLYPQAPSFRLTTANGNTMSLAETEGRGTLLVFYLGRGCFHCAMQLKEFAPRFKEFEEQGISILGVSADTPEALANAIEAFNGRIPFPLLSDSNKKVFSQFGLIVDGQEDPLHGTFLLDPTGKVLWYDFGDEPFLDITFLLEESVRLLEK